jgi:hypothetical protein
MKTVALIVTALVLTSCTFKGTYHSATGQKFDFDTSIVIPVEEYKK